MDKPTQAVLVKSIDLTKTSIAKITLHTGESISIKPHVEPKGILYGRVPHDAPGKWGTLQNKPLEFKVGTVPSLWDTTKE